MKSIRQGLAFPLPALWLCAAVTAWAQTAGGEPAAVPAAADRPALWFDPGETFFYRLYWGWLNVGAARVDSAWEEVDGRALVRIRYRARTGGLFEHIYPVDDHAEVYIDPDGFLPVRYRLLLKRRTKSYDEDIRFDYAAGRAHMRSNATGATREFALEPGTRDVMSFLYALRREALAVGDEKRYRFVGGEGPVDVALKVHAQEDVRLPHYGKVPCLRIEPRANFAGILIENGKVMAWASTDRRRLLTRMVIDGPLANVKVVLCRVRGPGSDPWVQGAADEPGECADVAETPAGPPPDGAPAAPTNTVQEQRSEGETGERQDVPENR